MRRNKTLNAIMPVLVALLFTLATPSAFAASVMDGGKIAALGSIRLGGSVLQSVIDTQIISTASAIQQADTQQNDQPAVQTRQRILQVQPAEQVLDNKKNINVLLDSQAGTQDTSAGTANDSVSISVSGSTKITPLLPAAGVPSAPSKLRSTFWPGSTKGGIEWNDNSSDETKFVIMEKPAGAQGFTQLAEVPANTTRYNLNLTEGYKGEYKVAAVNNSGTSDFSNSLTITIIPKAPENFRIENGSAAFDALKLYWTYTGQNADKLQLNVYKKVVNNGSVQIVPKDQISIPSGEDHSQVPYYYKNGKASEELNFCLSAYNSAGQSKVAKLDYEILPTPTYFTPGVWVDSPYFNLQWVDNAKNETAYIVKIVGKHQDPVKDVKVVKLPANTTSYKVELDPGEGWYMMVYAYKNDFAMSLPATMYWTAGTEAAPKAPDQLIASYDTSPGAVTLKWRDNANNDSYFVIERKGLSDMDFTKIGEVRKIKMADAMYIDKSVTPQIIYQYRIKAVNKWGESAYSEVIQGHAVETNALPDPVWGLSAAWQNDNSILLTWKHTGTKVTYYLVERKKGDGDFEPLMGVGVTADPKKSKIDISIPDNNSIDKNQTYYYRVAAVNGTYTSVFCQEAKAVKTGTGTGKSIDFSKFKLIDIKDLKLQNKN